MEHISKIVGAAKLRNDFGQLLLNVFHQLVSRQTYEIIKNGKDYLRFLTKDAVRSINPNIGCKVLNFFPEVDTVPENLLKIYITFSKLKKRCFLRFIARVMGMMYQ